MFTKESGPTLAASGVIAPQAIMQQQVIKKTVINEDSIDRMKKLLSLTSSRISNLVNSTRNNRHGVITLDLLLDL